MQVLKIESINFTGKPKIPTKRIQQTIAPEISKKVIGLAGVTSGLSLVGLSSNKDKSYEKTLEENYFKLPLGAKPDVFQKASAAYLYNGNDVLVTAPTGTGKTAIAHYAITKNLEEGKKTFYTAPLTMYIFN